MYLQAEAEDLAAQCPSSQDLEAVQCHGGMSFRDQMRLLPNTFLQIQMTRQIVSRSMLALSQDLQRSLCESEGFSIDVVCLLSSNRNALKASHNF